MAKCEDEALDISTTVTDLDYSLIEGSNGTGTVTMGSDGSITYGAGYSGAGQGTGGVFYIEGTKKNKGCRVDISCSNNATLSDGGGGAVGMLSIQIKEGGSGAAGTGVTCQGLDTPVITGYRIKQNTNQNDFYIGAALNTTSGVSSPNFSYMFNTANSGGSPITVRVEYED
ncbi:MAG: hypothetical protein MK052_06050 [Alphaproteobacteria bacterium]|nr:hypothetical protein [Alphaproteobacteria bacterium]